MKLEERDPKALFEAIEKKDTGTITSEIKKMLETSISYHEERLCSDGGMRENINAIQTVEDIIKWIIAQSMTMRL